MASWPLHGPLPTKSRKNGPWCNTAEPRWCDTFKPSWRCSEPLFNCPAGCTAHIAAARAATGATFAHVWKTCRRHSMLSQDSRGRGSYRAFEALVPRLKNIPLWDGLRVTYYAGRPVPRCRRNDRVDVKSNAECRKAHQQHEPEKTTMQKVKIYSLPT